MNTFFGEYVVCGSVLQHRTLFPSVSLLATLQEAPRGNFGMQDVKKKNFTLRPAYGKISRLALHMCSMRTFENIPKHPAPLFPC